EAALRLLRLVRSLSVAEEVGPGPRHEAPKLAASESRRRIPPRGESVPVDGMSPAPETLTLTEHRDRRGRRWQEWARRGAMLAVALVPLLALLNVFGQRPETSSAATGTARLQVYAPARARSGLVYA